MPAAHLASALMKFPWGKEKAAAPETALSPVSEVSCGRAYIEDPPGNALEDGSIDMKKTKGTDHTMSCKKA